MMISTNQFFNMVTSIQRIITEKEFQTIFGEDIGSHLYNKLIDEKDGDWMRLIGELDNTNQKLLSLHLLSK